jgi:hypothetical protein
MTDAVAGRHCEERPAFARVASYGGFESAEARSAKAEATKQSRGGARRSGLLRRPNGAPRGACAAGTPRGSSQ